MVTRFAASLPTDICPQPKEAQPLVSRSDIRLIQHLDLSAHGLVRRWLLIGYFPIHLFPHPHVTRSVLDTLLEALQAAGRSTPRRGGLGILCGRCHVRLESAGWKVHAGVGGAETGHTVPFHAAQRVCEVNGKRAPPWRVPTGCGCLMPPRGRQRTATPRR
jgi:hypothetical protein